MGGGANDRMTGSERPGWVFRPRPQPLPSLSRVQDETPRAVDGPPEPGRQGVHPGGPLLPVTGQAPLGSGGGAGGQDGPPPRCLGARHTFWWKITEVLQQEGLGA